MQGGPADEPGPRTSEVELTVGELADRVGMTVRNVRAYAARGLLPPPRLVGRTGYYGAQHVARLELVREMLAEGYTLAAIERSLEHAPASAGAAALALHRALMAPWLPDEPDDTDRATVEAKAGVPVPSEVLQRLASLGVVQLLDDDRIRVLDPTLLAAGLQVVRLGVDLGALIDAQLKVTELVEQAAAVYVDMFHRTVWQDYVDAGAPESERPRLRAVVETIQPVAAQALLASFRGAMATAVAQEMNEVVGQLSEDARRRRAAEAEEAGRA